MQGLLQDIIDAITSRQEVVAPEIDKSTFGVKGTIMHVTCANKAGGMKLPAEGYFQLAFAFRIKV